MFAISQFVLKSLKVCNSSSLPSYSIALGILLYASLYVYLLYYQNDYVYIFNKFVIYVIGIDLLLSAFLYFKQDTSLGTQPNSSLSISTDFEDNENVTLLNDDEELDQDQDSGYSQSDCETESVEELDMEQHDNLDQHPDIPVTIANMSGLEQQLDELLGTEQLTPITQQVLTETQQNTPEQPIQTSATETKEPATEIEADADTEIELTELQSEPPKRKRGRPPKGQSALV